MEAPVRALRDAFACEHARRVFAGALEREHAGRVRELPGDILEAEEAHELTPVRRAGQRDLRDARAGERLDLRGHADLAAADLVDEVVGGVLRAGRLPLGESLAQRGVEVAEDLVVSLPEYEDGRVGAGVGQGLGRVVAVDGGRGVAELPQ